MSHVHTATAARGVGGSSGNGAGEAAAAAAATTAAKCQQWQIGAHIGNTGRTTVAKRAGAAPQAQASKLRLNVASLEGAGFNTWCIGMGVRRQDANIDESSRA